MQITRDWLDRLADSASGQPSDADVILVLAASIEAMGMQGALSADKAWGLASRLHIIASHLIVAGDSTDKALT